MSYLLSQLEGAERHAECIRQDAALVQAMYPALEAANEAPRLRAYLVTIGHRPSFEVMATSSFAAWEQHVGMASGDERVEVRKVVRHG